MSEAGAKSEWPEGRGARPRRGEPLVIAQVIQSLADHLQELGVDPRPLLARRHLTPEVLQGVGGQAPLKSYVRLFEDAAEALGRPSIGLDLSARVGPEVLGALGFMFLSSRTLGEALESLTRYTAAIQDATESDVIVRGGLATVTYQIRADDISPRAQDAEFSIACTYRLVRAYARPGGMAREVHFEHSPQAPMKAYEAAFRCPVYFRQPVNGLVLDAADLALTASAVNPKLHPILESHVRDLMSRKAAVSGMADRVSEALAPSALREGASAARVAAGFGLSESTLHRRLKQEGTSFQALIDARRFELAGRLLADPQMSIADVAAALGYSEHAAFTRAFRRWSGRTPRAFRAAI